MDVAENIQRQGVSATETFISFVVKHPVFVYSLLHPLLQLALTSTDPFVAMSLHSIRNNWVAKNTVSCVYRKTNQQKLYVWVWKVRGKGTAGEKSAQGLLVIARRLLRFTTLWCELWSSSGKLLYWKAYLPLVCHALPPAKRLCRSLGDSDSTGWCSCSNSETMAIEGGPRYSSCWKGLLYLGNKPLAT